MVSGLRMRTPREVPPLAAAAAKRVKSVIDDRIMPTGQSGNPTGATGVWTPSMVS